MSLTIQPYRNIDELHRTHPEIKSYKCILHTAHGMSDEVKLTQLRKAIQRRGMSPNLMVYQVGDFYWAEAETTPPVKCRCLEVIGDNGPCLEHGDPFAEGTAEHGPQTPGRR